MLNDGLLTEGHQVARLDGGVDVLWEPMWQIQVKLQPVERTLLTTPALRRLHFLHHGGASCLAMPHTYSRFQHVLGVFALVAHFCPDDELLRVAALLHDVGHAPFSHTLEKLDGVDHHRWTIDRLFSAPIVDILRQHNIDPQDVLDRIDGNPANLLRNHDGFVHADHLDSWVRSARASGLLSLPAPTLLTRLRLNGDYLDTDIETAELLVELIVAEARFHTSAVNLGLDTMLVELVRTALDTGVLTTNALSKMTDSMVEHVLFETSATAEAARQLWFRPDTVMVHKQQDDNLPSGAQVVPVHRLYLSVPLVNGQSAAEISPRIVTMFEKAQALLGTYAVFWRDG